MWARDLTDCDGGSRCNPLAEARCCSHLRPVVKPFAHCSARQASPDSLTLALPLSRTMTNGSILCRWTFVPCVGFPGPADPALPVRPVSAPPRRSSPRPLRLGPIPPDGVSESGRASFVGTRKLGLITLTQMHARSVHGCPGQPRNEARGMWATLDHSGERRQHAVTAAHYRPANSPISGARSLPPLHLVSPVCASKSLRLATRAQRFDR